jgi:hypothetical protein
MSRRTRKLALKKETLRRLDDGALQQAGGGYVYKTAYCGGGSQAGVSGGCTTADDYSMKCYPTLDCRY